MERRLAPVRSIAFVALALTLLAAAPSVGWWVVFPLSGAVVGWIVLARGLEKSRRPEYRLAAAWCLGQLMIAGSIAITGGADSAVIAWLVIPAVTLPARFPRRGLIGGAAVTVALLFLATAEIVPAAQDAELSRTLTTLTLIVCVLVLSTALMRSDLEHRAEAVMDSLTGMLNRSALSVRVAELTQQARLAGQPVALVVADVDRFKLLNDEHGHAKGDVVLAEVARRIRGELRAYDAAYRIGGDEFLIVLPGAAEQSAVELAEALRRAVSLDPVEGLDVTLSVGVSASADTSFDFDEVFESADRALYAAKSAGRDRVNCSSGLHVAGDGPALAA
jgi:diguanylate cyclase (GGDEF)-like protein